MVVVVALMGGLMQPRAKAPAKERERETDLWDHARR